MRARLVVLALLVAACSDAPLPVAPAPELHKAQTPPVLVDTTGLARVFGPDTFVRNRGEPRIERRSIVTAGFKAPFVLVIERGGLAKDHEDDLDAVVTLDGHNVFPAPNHDDDKHVDDDSHDRSDHGGDGRDEGDHHQTSWLIPVTVGPTAELTVRLRGERGTTVIVTLLGKRAFKRFCPADVGDGASFADFPSAIAAANPNDTIVVCDGVHVIPAVVSVPKPISITSEHPLGATLNVTAGGFRMLGVTSGTVAFFDLRFQGALFSAIDGGATNWDTIRVERNVFTFTGNAIVVNAQIGVPGAVAIVRDNEFAGGLTSVFAVSGTPGPHAVIERNQIHGQTFSGIQIQSTASARIANNDIYDCGPVACIQLSTVGFVEIIDNTIHSSAPHISSNAISYSSSTVAALLGSRAGLVVTGNSILGSVPSNPADTLTYAFRGAAINLNPSAAPNLVRVEHNTAQYAGEGVRVSFLGVSDTLAVSDNVFDGMRVGVQRNGLGPLNAVVGIHRNDFTGYQIPLLTPNATSTVTCNWWGAASGPVGVSPAIAPGTYTPFAASAIANQPGVVCTPPPPPPAGIARFCPPEAGIVANTFGSMAAAIAAISPGDTVLVCDGTWTSSAGIIKALTLRAEHPGAATFTASPFSIFAVPSGRVVIRDLNFILSSGIEISVGNGNFHLPPVAWDQVVITHNTFTFPTTFPGGIIVTSSSVAGAHVTVDQNTFVSGGVAVRADSAAVRIDVTNNILNGQHATAVDLNGPGTYGVRGNVITGCGFNCIRTFVSFGTPAAGHFAAITGNTTTVAAGAGTSIGIEAASGDSVANNTLTTTGTIPDRTLFSNYGFNQAGIQVDSISPALAAVVGNTVNGAAVGLLAVNGSVNATDNLLAVMNEAVRVGGATASVHRNDFTDYLNFTTGALAVPVVAGTMTCNWWGSATGPIGVPFIVAPAVYTPFSIVPIAHQPGVICP